jgi:outer membrane protein OmpA-like peptidoglycan-associated protein
VVLLPDEDGTTGRAHVSNEFGGVDLLAARQATVATSAGQPSPIRVMDAAEVTRVFGAALAAMPPAPRRFTLRFRFDSDELTDESRAMLPVILNAVKAYPLPEVAVVGHTDTLGDAKANVALGLKRAMSVERLLVLEGLDASIVAVSSHGEAELDVRTPNNTAEPRNRRVEIVVR